ncbi:hypothetical protein Rcae01_03500 [Novipirellula caenicola]|uniref:DUF4325 domain-containing protein n=1 Tax=Novipirellula caenicola TaxID=1536901 RepID=A0ABP9VUR2_9BACT
MLTRMERCGMEIPSQIAKVDIHGFSFTKRLCPGIFATIFDEYLSVTANANNR